jgi:hypothetical protein
VRLRQRPDHGLRAALVESPLRLRGTSAIDTKIGPLDQPDAILCRTNAGTITEIFRLLEQKKRVALGGGGKSLDDLARAAGDLKASRRASHPELVLFQTWGELQDYATYDPAGATCSPWWTSSTSTASSLFWTPSADWTARARQR